jgi:enoyl-CoA hydratase/carnithine racemase
VAEEKTEGDKGIAVQREARLLEKSIASKSVCAVRIGKRTLYQQQAASSLDEAYIISSRAMVENLEMEDARHGIQSFLKVNTRFGNTNEMVSNKSIMTS